MSDPSSPQEIPNCAVCGDPCFPENNIVFHGKGYAHNICVKPEPSRDLGINKIPVGLIHKAVRNFIANELKIDRNAITELIRPIVKSCFNQLFSNESNWIKHLVNKSVEECIKSVVEHYVRNVMRDYTTITVQVAVPKIDTP